jgi:hypothetical protein
MQVCILPKGRPAHPVTEQSAVMIDIQVCLKYIFDNSLVYSLGVIIFDKMLVLTDKGSTPTTSLVTGQRGLEQGQMGDEHNTVSTRKLPMLTTKMVVGR